MFEHPIDPLPSRLTFLFRFARNFLAGLAIILGSLFIGMIGYRHYEGMSWIDAFLNASMLLSGMGPIGSPQTHAGKLFAGSYALYSGFVVILASGIVFAPVVHRLLHKFHLSVPHHKRAAHDHSTSQESQHGQVPERPSQAGHEIPALAKADAEKRTAAAQTAQAVG